MRIPGPGAGRRLSGGGVPQPGGGPQRPGYFRPSALSGRRRPCAGRGAPAAGIGVYEVPALVERYGGAAWPAHIDRSSFSLLSNLGLWDPGLGFSLAEVSRNCPPDFVSGRRDLRGVPTITGCDAHYLEQISDAGQVMEVPARSREAVLAWLRRGGA